MFDTVTGLPVHVLVVHAVVVLVPLAAVLTIATAVRPGWRPALPWVVLLSALNVPLAIVATQSGEAFEGRLFPGATPAVVHEHEEAGELMPLVAIVFLLVSVATWVVLRRGAGESAGEGGSSVLGRSLVAVTAVVAIVALAVAVRAGHTGSEAVWADIVSNTAPAGGE